jgi:hypothetical protein
VRLQGILRAAASTVLAIAMLIRRPRRRDRLPVGLERRIGGGGRPFRTPALRRPWFIRIERVWINEHDATAGAFVEARCVQRRVRPRDNNSAKKSAAADMTSKSALGHCPKGAESGTVCLYSMASHLRCGDTQNVVRLAAARFLLARSRNAQSRRGVRFAVNVE